MSPMRSTESLACWNCYHSPTRRSIGWDSLPANIWKATSMPMVKSVPFAAETVVCPLFSPIQSNFEKSGLRFSKNAVNASFASGAPRSSP